MAYLAGGWVTQAVRLRSGTDGTERNQSYVYCGSGFGTGVSFPNLCRSVLHNNARCTGSTQNTSDNSSPLAKINPPASTNCVIV